MLAGVRVGVHLPSLFLTCADGVGVRAVATGVWSFVVIDPIGTLSHFAVTTGNYMLNYR